MKRNRNGGEAFMKRIMTEYLKPFYPRMGLGVFFKFTGSIMDLCIPYILAYIIDSVIPLNDQTQIYYWGGVMVICAIIGMVFNIIANRIAVRVASDATEIIRHDLFSKVMVLSNHQMDIITKPSVISRLTTDTYNVHQMIIRIQRLGVRAPIMLIGGIIVTMLLDPVLAMVLIGIMPIMIVIIILVSKKSIPLFGGFQQAVDGFVRLVREDINGIRVIKALSKTDYEKNRFDAINEEVVNREKRARMTIAVIQPAIECMYESRAGLCGSDWSLWSQQRHIGSGENSGLYDLLYHYSSGCFSHFENIRGMDEGHSFG